MMLPCAHRFRLQSLPSTIVEYRATVMDPYGIERAEVKAMRMMVSPKDFGSSVTVTPALAHLRPANELGSVESTSTVWSTLTSRFGRLMHRQIVVEPRR